MQPTLPISCNQRRNNGKQNCRTDHSRGVPMRKLGNGILNLGFCQRRIFNQFQNFGDGGFGINLCYAQVQHPADIDTAADCGISLCHFSRNGFSRQRARIQLTFTLQYHAVKRNFFAGTDNDNFSRLYILRCNRFFLSISQNTRLIGTDIHDCGNRTAAFSNGNAFKQLSDLIKQHDKHRLRIFGKYQCANRSNAHQKIFVQKLTACKVLHRLTPNIPTDNGIRNQKECQTKRYTLRQAVEKQTNTKSQKNAAGN